VWKGLSVADLTPRVLGQLARLAPTAPGATPPTPAFSAEPADRAALREHLLQLRLSAFAQAGHCLEVRVPWAPVPLWFVPTEADADALARKGIGRGRCWTADELRMLLAIPGITKAQARQIDEAKLAFEGDVVAVEPTAPADGEADWALAAPTSAPRAAGGPAALPGPGSAQLGVFASCDGCGTETWVVDDDAPRCPTCSVSKTARSVEQQHGTRNP
jgi:hypothetical protein